MLTIRDLTGTEEALTDIKEMTVRRKVNGEKTLSLTIVPTKVNRHAYNMVDEETILTFENEEYVIKKLSERSIGKTSIKRVEAIHRFFVDMINKQQPNVHNGSMTFAAFLNFVFDGTGYTYSIIDSFGAKTFENLGNDNRLSLHKKGLERYKAEVEIVDKNVRFRTKIGNDTDFQFRYGHNIQALEKSVDTTNLATVIRGTGAEGITAYYRSPNADIFGEIDAPPVNDERFATKETLLTEMKSVLQDTPEVSLTIDFADLRAAGYPYTIPNEGDRVFVIYEPMNDLLIETRIMEIDETYDNDFKPIKTTVTLANYKKTFTGTLLGNVQKSLSAFVNDDGIIRYNVLDEAVRIATEALQSAQTELIFENGITGVDKDNPNYLTRFTSRGIGVSSDGGNTFPDAIVKGQINTSLLAAGNIKTNNIQIIGTDDLFYWDGNYLISIDAADSQRYVKLNSEGLYIARGAMIIERPDGFKVIDNGIANFDLNVQGGTPQYIDDAKFEDGTYVLTTDGPYTRTASTAYRRFDYFRLRHTSRFVHFAFYAKGGGGGAYAYVRIVDNAGNILATNMTNATGDTNIGITIDMGIPTGEEKLLYAEIRTTSTANPCLVRLATKYMTG